MRLLACLVVLASLVNPLLTRGTENATARIWCLSLRFQEGTDSFGDTLDLSTIGATFPNGELAPYNGLQYISGFALDVSGIPVIGTIYLNLPAVSDLNGNGFNDFFESALDMQGISTGTYTTVMENGTVSASWQRSAGSKDGTCILHLVDSIYGDLGQFRHVFSLIEYNGSLSFTSGSNTVAGTLSLVQAGDPTSELGGPIQFVKVSTNRFDRLVLQPGSWTNASAQMLSYTNDLFRRDLPWYTNYYGFIEYDDGDPNTGQPDYLFWLLSIDDPNDSNNNRIPDFSDDPPTAPPPQPPAIALIQTTTNLLIAINGTVGHLHEIQRTTALPATNWQTVVSLTLTNTSQLLPLDYPTNTSAFWRVVAH